MPEYHNVTRRIVSGVLTSGFLTVVNIIVSLVQFRIVIRWLPGELSGLWILFLTIGSYISFFDLGISPTISREISFQLGSSEGGSNATVELKRIANLIATCQNVFNNLAIISLVIGSLIGGFFIKHVTSTVYMNEGLIAWLIFAIGASLNFLGSAGFASLYGLGHVSAERIIRAIIALVSLLLSIVVLRLGLGIIGLSCVWAIQGIASKILCFFLLYRLNPELKHVNGEVQPLILKSILLPSVKLALTQLGAFLILQTDNVVIAGTLGSSAIPKYAAVSKVVTTLSSFSLMIVTSTTPFLSRYHAAGQTTALIELMQRNVRFGVAFMVHFCAYLACFGDKVISIWLGASNFVGYPILWVFLVMLTLEVHHVILASATMSTGKVVFHWVALLAGILNIIISLILVRRLGLLGVALGTMFAQITTNNWYAPYITLRLFNISFSWYIKRILFPISLLLLIEFFANKVLSRLLLGTSLPINLIISFLVSSVLGLILVWSLIITNNEKSSIIRKLSNGGR